MNSINQPKLTPTEQRVYDLLGDGREHTYDEVREAIDPLVERQTVAKVLCAMRPKLAEIQELLISQSYGRRVLYRRARMLVVHTDDR